MKQSNRSSVEVVNGIVLDVFKLNGYFIKAADCLTKGSELTSARWQVLGTVLHEQYSVAEIARSLGLTRQAVQRIADRLVEDGLAEYLPNPAHKRAKLLSCKEKGLNSIKEIRPKVVSWADRVYGVIGEEELKDAEWALKNLLSKLLEAEEELLNTADYDS
jgi:DNA-binding MarR family transcriptional regulator